MSLQCLAASKLLNLSLYVSTAKHEEMKQVMSGIVSCKKEMLSSKHKSCTKTTEKLKGRTHLFLEQNEQYLVCTSMGIGITET